MSRELFDKKLAVLGAGKLGGILLRAYLKQGLFDVSRTTATVKHAERAAALAKQHQLTKKQGLQMLEDLIGMITKHLKKGERVKIAGLGILVVRNRAARMGRNPMTGEPIKIKASRKVAFRAAKDLKMAI